LVLGLTIGLAAAAWCEGGWYKPDDPEHKAAEKAVLDNEWIDKLPYVTGVEGSWLVCPNEKKELTALENNILVETELRSTRLYLRTSCLGHWKDSR